MLQETSLRPPEKPADIAISVRGPGQGSGIQASCAAIRLWEGFRVQYGTMAWPVILKMMQLKLQIPVLSSKLKLCFPLGLTCHPPDSDGVVRWSCGHHLAGILDEIESTSSRRDSSRVSMIMLRPAKVAFCEARRYNIFASRHDFHAGAYGAAGG